jgi:hypothetical protein
MDMKRFFLYPVAIAAMALAGCGGNGVTMPTTTPPDGTTPTTPTNGFVIAQQSRVNAAAAAEMAEEAVKAAMEASDDLDALSVKGDSMMAQMNAQTVLDQRDAANQAVMAAETALQNAKTALGAVDANTTNATELTAALEEAIMVAEAQVEMAKEQAEGDALKMAVEMVTGTDEDMPMTPADTGKAVAMSIGMALLPTDAADGGSRAVTHDSTAPAATDMDAVKMNDSQGMTWTKIVGAANVMDMRIGTTGGGTMAVKAMSVSDMTLTSGQNAADMVDDGTQVDSGIMYKGIPGTVFCAGSDCAVEAVLEDGTVNDAVKKLTGSWYFTPASLMAAYVKNADDTAYMAETMYAQFGHWLTEANNGDVTIMTYARSGANKSGLELTIVNTTGDVLTDTSATYTGSAAGMSLHKTFDGNAAQTGIYSGAFTADVTLEATFGDSPMLEGTVDTFVGPATDSEWTVELMETAFTGATFNTGVTDATGQAGEWSAQGYGADGERPAGIFGGFNAHFTDGHAAGAYATRKE